MRSVDNCQLYLPPHFITEVRLECHRSIAGLMKFWLRSFELRRIEMIQADNRYSTDTLLKYMRGNSLKIYTTTMKLNQKKLHRAKPSAKYRPTRVVVDAAYVATYWKDQTRRAQNCKYLRQLSTDLKTDFTNGFSIFFWWQWRLKEIFPKRKFFFGFQNLDPL